MHKYHTWMTYHGYTHTHIDRNSGFLVVPISVPISSYFTQAIHKLCVSISIHAKSIP